MSYLTFQSLVALVVFSLNFQPAAAGRPMPLMMPDDFDDLQGVWWRVEPAMPDTQNPLVEGETPWDRGGVMTHGTVLKDPLDGRFKGWLVCTPAQEVLDNVDSQNHRLRRLCYFESADGIQWKRVEVPNSTIDGRDRSNVVFNDEGGTQYASVMVDPAKAPWPYEMFVFRNMYARKKVGFTHLHHLRSRDGKAWEAVAGPIQGPFAGDVCFVHPASAFSGGAAPGYVAYYRLHGEDPLIHKPIYEAPTGLTSRQLFRAESANGRDWTGGEKIVLRDERDHRDTQYMELVPLRVRERYIGVVSMYHPITQTQNLRTGVSRDGKKWWFPDRRASLDNGPLGDYGGGMLWQSKNLVEHDGRVYVYYGAMEGIHRPLMDTRGEGFVKVGEDRLLDRPHSTYPFNSALCRASWQVGRYYALASAAGGPTVGVATTVPRDLVGRSVRVNVRTQPAKRASPPGLDEGGLQIEILDATGKPVVGFSRSDCVAIRGDHSGLKVAWLGGDVAPAGAAKLRFYLKRAFLYGFEIGE